MPRERSSVKLVGVRQTGNCECSLRPVTLLRRFDRGIAPRRVRAPSQPRVCHFPSLKAPSPRWETPRQGRRGLPRRCLDEPPRHVSDLTVRARSETGSPGRGSLSASLLGPVSTPTLLSTSSSGCELRAEVDQIARGVDRCHVPFGVEGCTYSAAVQVPDPGLSGYGVGTKWPVTRHYDGYRAVGLGPDVERAGCDESD